MLYSAQPGKKTIENDIIDRMNELSLECRLPTQFEAAALRREIDRIKKTDAPCRNNLLGMLSALELDLENAKKHHRAAIRASGNAPYYRNHYAVTLTKLFVFDEAISVLEQLAEADPADLVVLDLLLNASMASGRYRLASKWTEAWSQRCPEKPRESAEYLTTRIIPYLDEADLKDSDIGPVFDRALRVLSKNGKHCAEMSVRWPDDDDTGLCLVVRLREPVETIADLMVELCEVEADCGPAGQLVNKVSVSFSPMAA